MENLGVYTEYLQVLRERKNVVPFAIIQKYGVIDRIVSGYRPDTPAN